MFPENNYTGPGEGIPLPRPSCPEGWLVPFGKKDLCRLLSASLPWFLPSESRGTILMTSPHTMGPRVDWTEERLNPVERVGVNHFSSEALHLEVSRLTQSNSLFLEVQMPGQLSPAKAVTQATLGFFSASVLGWSLFWLPAAPGPRCRGCPGHGSPRPSTSPHTSGNLCRHVKTCCIQTLGQSV